MKFWPNKFLLQSIKITLAIAVAGCATVEKPATRKPSQISASTEVPKVVRNELQVYPLSWVGSSQCPAGATVEKTKDWKELVKFANRCMAQKKYRDLNLIATKLAEVEPNMPWGAYYLSLEAEAVGQSDRAMWMVDLAIKKASNVGVLKYQKGRLMWKKGFVKESVREMEDALKQDPNITDAHLVLGEAYLSELDFKTAQEHYLKVLAGYPTQVVALAGIVDVYIELERAALALQYIQTAIQSYPRSMNFRLKEAFVYENLTQQTEIALARFKEIKRLIAKKALDGAVPFDLEAKIKDLESTVKSSKKLAMKGN